VKPREPGARPKGLAKLTYTLTNLLSSVASFVQKTLVIAELEVRKLRHDPAELFVRAVQPVLWLVIFGEVFTHVPVIPTGQLPYLDFMTPGILAQSALFIAIFGGMTIIWERDLGVVHKFLVSPTPREALALGKALSGGVRALSQAVVIYVLAVALGVKLSWNPLGLIGVLTIVVLTAASFYAFSMTVAFIVRTRERFMGVGQLLTMPTFFASNAIYPISIMPRWLQVVAHANPLTYEVDALRTLMLPGETSAYGLGVDFGVLLFATAVMVTIAARLYPRAAT
jgi:ABC-2 type transport system permease protein